MIKLIVVGKLKEQYLVNMVEDYKKMLNGYITTVVDIGMDLKMQYLNTL